VASLAEKGQEEVCLNGGIKLRGCSLNTKAASSKVAKQ